jgi:hypothetical protein
LEFLHLDENALPLEYNLMNILVLVYPIFGLLKRVVLCFPVLESEEATNAFVWVVGKHQTEAVAKEQDAIATRNRSPERLQTPMLRALRQTRDFYFDDVRDHPNDDVAQRIPRWGKEVQTLPVYRKIDIPHPVMVAWEYNYLKKTCDVVKKEAGFSGWTEFAAETEESKGPTWQSGQIPFRSWSEDDPPVSIDVPDDANPSEAALAFLSKRTGLSVAHLDKLIDRGNRFFPKELSTMLLGRWEAVARDHRDELRFDFAEIDERLGGFQFYGSFIPADLNLSLEQIEGFSKLLRSKK